MTVEDRRGAAYHEAGHIVVAWAFGLNVGAAAIGLDGDDAKGESKIERDTTLLLIDKIAICAAGVEAQHVFRTPTSHYAVAMDEAEIIRLTEHLNEKVRLARRDEGYERAHELILAHRAKVHRIAESLFAQGSLNAAEIHRLLQ
jgi:hypothetical protein